MYFSKIYDTGAYYQTMPAERRPYTLYAECSRGYVRLRKRWPPDPSTPATWGWEAHFDIKVKGVKKRIYKSGVEPTLAKAARQALKRLLSQRIDSIGTLLKILANDQALYELSKLGGPTVQPLGIR